MPGVAGAQEEQGDGRPRPGGQGAHGDEGVHGGGAVPEVDQRRPVEGHTRCRRRPGVARTNATHCQPSNIRAGTIEIRTSRDGQHAATSRRRPGDRGEAGGGDLGLVVGLGHRVPEGSRPSGRNASGSARLGSRRTVARAAARLTSARSTPSSLPRPRPMRVAQAAQVIPSTGRSMRFDGGIGGSRGHVDEDTPLPYLSPPPIRGSAFGSARPPLGRGRGQYGSGGAAGGSAIDGVAVHHGCTRAEPAAVPGPRHRGRGGRAAQRITVEVDDPLGGDGRRRGCGCRPARCRGRR